MHIALVEPGKIGRIMMSRMIEERGDTVTEFVDGQAAYDFLLSGEPVDALITSIEIPGMNGLELCWNARVLSEKTGYLYIAVVSSSREIHTAIEALDSGADDFIRKPPIPSELQAKLRAAERLSKVQKKLIDMATRDPMTGLLNRRSFFEQAADVLDKSPGNPISAIMLDIDLFKSINDTYGHHIGDVAICTVSDLIKREPGLQARLGGEEFVILLPDTIEQEAALIAERLRATFENTELDADTGTFHLTCSFGVCQSGKGENETIDDLLKRADSALYQSKNDGRNRVTIGQPGEITAPPDTKIRRR